MLTAKQILGQDESALIDCGNGHQLLPQTAQDFAKMQLAAKQDDVDIQIASSYRNFERQLNIWNQKWQGQRPLFSIEGAKLDADALSDKDKLNAILTWSALPGASRHHWGTDLDVFDKTRVEQANHKFELVPEEYAPDGPCYQLNEWLNENAENFGFSRPYKNYTGGVAPEAWHLSYTPIAGQVSKQLDLKTLTQLIKNTDIFGKEVILTNLEEIFTRYTLNQGEQA